MEGVNNNNDERQNGNRGDMKRNMDMTWGLVVDGCLTSLLAARERGTKGDREWTNWMDGWAADEGRRWLRICLVRTLFPKKRATRGDKKRWPTKKKLCGLDREKFERRSRERERELERERDNTGRDVG